MARNIIKEAVSSLASDAGCSCGDSLQFAIMTDPAKIPERARKDLALLLGKYLD